MRSVDECKPTRITHEMKLPIDWQQQQIDRVAKCIHKNQIPDKLVFNIDESFTYLLVWCVGEVMIQLKNRSKMLTNLVESWPKSMGGDMHCPEVIAAGITNIPRLFPNHVTTGKSTVPVPDGEKPFPKEGDSDGDDDEAEFSEEECGEGFGT